MAAALRVNPYFLKDYDTYARNFSLPRTKKSIGILLEYDLKSKGLGSNETEDGELLKEMVYKLLA
jgi:DNA polymerase-3 subunit delta